MLSFFIALTAYYYCWYNLVNKLKMILWNLNTGSYLQPGEREDPERPFLPAARKIVCAGQPCVVFDHVSQQGDLAQNAPKSQDGQGNQCGHPQINLWRMRLCCVWEFGEWTLRTFEKECWQRLHYIQRNAWEKDRDKAVIKHLVFSVRRWWILCHYSVQFYVPRLSVYIQT